MQQNKIDNSLLWRGYDETVEDKYNSEKKIHACALNYESVENVLFPFLFFLNCEFVAFLPKFLGHC